MSKTSYQRQVEIEKEAMEIGIDRYHQQRLPWQASPSEQPESGRPVGSRLVTQALEPVTKAINEYIHETLYAKKHGGARIGLTGARIMEAVGAETCAYAGLKVCVDCFGTSKGFTPMYGVIGGISKMVMTQYHLIRLAEDEWANDEEQEPSDKAKRNYAQAIQKRISTTQSEKYKAGVVAGALRDKVGEPEQLDDKTYYRMGTKILEKVYENTGLIEFKVVRRKNRKEQMIYPSQEALDWMEQEHEKAEKLYPLKLPMVHPPKKWSTPFNGGYLTKGLSSKLVRTYNRNYLEDLKSKDLSTVFKSLNAIQDTPWRVNKAVAKVVRELWDNNHPVGKLPPREMMPLPAKPENMDTDEEARAEWRKEAAAVHDYNTRIIGKRVATAQKLWIVERFQDEPQIFFPHQLDWRGRIYPIPTLVNPQGDDLSKSMLEFAEGKPLGEDGATWLAIHLANLWGEDKVSLEDRVSWTLNNTQMILDCAMYPTDGQMKWTEADEPFQFLAACFEWLGYKITGPSYVSHQPIAVDGTCSGLQHFSAMLRDPEGGRATNLRPAPEPQDIYGIVAERTREKVQSDLQNNVEEAKNWTDNVDRSLCKRPTMTLPYGVTRFGMRDQITDYLKEEKNDGNPLLPANVSEFTAAGYISKKIHDSISETVVAATTAMDWLQEVAKVVAEDGLPVNWVTPCGFPVQQDYRKMETVRVDTHFGGVRIAPSFGKKGKEIDKRRQANGIAPNYVHSMDASHLMLTVSQALDEGIGSFAMIHDSFGTHAADAPYLGYTIRKTFVEQYSVDQLEEFRQQVIDQLPDELAERIPQVPEKGDLDITEVMDSMFFFA